jgi:ABC-type spermidine/putrescine transport system permease subunit II
MPKWKPDFRRSTYLTVHFYLSLMLSAIFVGAALWLFTVVQNMAQGLWALAMAVILLGSIPGVVVAEAEERGVA